MKIQTRLTLLAAALTLFAALSYAQDDPVFRAMQDEMSRSVEKLSIPSVPPPYFLSYRMRDYDRLYIKARYGGLVESDRSQNRYLYLDLRIGGDSLDNSNFFGGWQDVYRNRLDLVAENQYDALRHQLWLATDEAFKDAAEKLAGKKSWLQAHPAKEMIPDLSPADPYVLMAKPVAMEADQAAVEMLLKTASKAFDEFTQLEDWQMEFTGQTVNQRYLNSQGSRHLKGQTQYILEIMATAQAADGQRLSNFLQYVVMKPGELPSISKPSRPTFARWRGIFRP